MKKSALDPRMVLADFFANQDVVRVGVDPRGFPTYVPDENGAKFLVIRIEDRPRSNDVRDAAHEIGHFITAPIDRLGLPDYGYPTITQEPWRPSWWEAEFDVLAIQSIILREHRRSAVAKRAVEDAALFVRGDLGKRYVESRPAFARSVAKADFLDVLNLTIIHVAEEVQRRVEERIGGYAAIVDEFHRRCDLLRTNRTLG